ncbi:MAG: TetR/AcrR family transcriptional regulator [Spirochaetales bacterium]|nr:TetR/AcrR family transcriptional regulator [Spirochaetales bacterium]
MPSKGDNTRNLILEKAAELFIQKGYSAVTMKDVCEATSLSRGGLYRHFKSTGEMMACLLLDEQQTADEEFSAALAEGKSALQLLDAYIQKHDRFLLSPGSALEVAANQYALLDEVGRKINTSRVWSTVKRLTSIIRLGQGEGVFIDGNPENIAWHIVFFICGIRAQTVLVEPGADFIHTQTDYIRRFLLKG